MTGLLLKPNYIALDTSHYSQWVRDSLSARKDERDAASGFTARLEESGSLPLMTLHHLAELCAHEDRALVAQRLRFLHRLKLVAWIADSGTQPSIGGVTSILASEVLAAYRNPSADVSAVRAEAARSLIRVGTGEDMLGHDPHDWLALVPSFLETERERPGDCRLDAYRHRRHFRRHAQKADEWQTQVRG